MIPESRVVADLLLRGVQGDDWKQAIEVENLLRKRSPTTAMTKARVIRARLQTMSEGLWTLARDGSAPVATHAVFAATVKFSPLVGDFLDLVVREQYQLFSPALPSKLWEDYIEGCRGRDPEMPEWSESTVHRLRSSVFQILAQAGYIESTRTLKLQTVHIAKDVLRYLKDHDEKYVLRCIQVSP